MNKKHHCTHKPEIMSPAGYWPQMMTAIEAGADAVYFGLKHFSARAKVGFSLEELPDAMRTLHQRGVRGYVTFNTLVFDHELTEAARTLGAIAAAGADAIIVQDLGIAQLAHEIAPALEIHGSTQMSITSAEGIALAQRFGVSRVVLARELSLDDVRTIRAQTACELELFVHGALCVSYSGQCFSSEAWGGRSANRGQCAQACRLPYELLVDDQVRPLGDARYLLSPGDLYALPHIPEIMQIGIAALKIEGRYKDAHYVALTTRAYRQAVDRVWAGQPVSISRAEEIQLEQVYSRGLGDYFIGGTDHQAVVKGRAPRHRGVLVGRVVRVLADRLVIAPAPTAAVAPLKAGDGIVIDSADWRSPEEPEEGGRVYGVTPLRTDLVEVRFGKDAITSGRIRPGDLLWRTHDPEVDKATRAYVHANAPLRRQPVDVVVQAHEGAPLRLTWTLVEHPDISAIVCADEPLQAAQSQTLTSALLREQVGRLGTSPYALRDLQLDMRGQPFAPSSLLNHLRRQAVERLMAIQSQPAIGPIDDPAAILARTLAAIVPPPIPQTHTPPALHLLVRTADQLTAALALRPTSITLDYLELYGLRPAVERVQAEGIAVRVASPRVLKPNEQRIIHFLRKLGCPIVVRSSGLLHALRQEAHPALIGDFSLNIANQLTAEQFLHLGLTHITPTHDLNAAQITTLAHRIGAQYLEVIAYQHLPVFHTEHCVFCRFLSQGTSYKDCGHPCEQQRIALRDQSGRSHPVMADVGCRNTVFGAEAQEASRHLTEWRAAGIHHFRLEFAHESPDDLYAIGQAFQQALHDRLPMSDLTRQLQHHAPQGTTEGSLFIPNDYLMVPLLQ